MLLAQGSSQTPSKYERYEQRKLILSLFGYKMWSKTFYPPLFQKAIQIAKRDVSQSFIVFELIAYLVDKKIVRPGYTTLQKLISKCLSYERNRLCEILENMLDESTKILIQKLIIHDDTLLNLAIIKQDAKHFGYRQMALERQKRNMLLPLYKTTKLVLDKLDISHQNMNYYAGLANFYTIYDLRRLRQSQAYLYLLCYAWERYRQFTDNLVDAMGYHMKKLEDETKIKANKKYLSEQDKRQQENHEIGQLLLLYVDDDLVDSLPFGVVRKQAFTIMPKDTLQTTGQRLTKKLISRQALRWEMVDEVSQRVSQNLRPIYMTLDFTSMKANNSWIAALKWMKDIFENKKRLSHQEITECPEGTIPSRLQSFFLANNTDESKPLIHAKRYEFWIYRQIRKRFKSGEIYLNDSIQHRHFNDELVSEEKKNEVLSQLDIPWLQKPVESQIEDLSTELTKQWVLFNSELTKGKLTHLNYDVKTKTLVWNRPNINKEKEQQERFYSKLASCDITDVFRFVNKECDFLSALTPLQPRYLKKEADEDSLMAVIIAQAMNHGNLTMANTSDIPYHVLETTYQQYLRLDSLQSTNDCISNAITNLSIFPHYSFDLDTLYGGIDGQKFVVERPTIKARHSRKYFGKGKGVVAYTLICNHVPIQGWLIGAHEYEGHYVFDVCHQNTSDILPTAITGDLHSVNKANFAILHWFGMKFEPRFTNLKTQLKHIHGVGDPAQYENYLIAPNGQIDTSSIVNEKDNINHIIATLSLKEINQSSLIRKLCTYSPANPTRKAIFECDKLTRSIYTLRYLRSPKLQKIIYRSQNRIESYHQLRSAIAQVGGKKELTGKTDIEIEISNQCARLVANTIIYYNSAILSRLLSKYENTLNEKMLELIKKKISPVAWQHIILNGHYTFRGKQDPIDLDKIVSDILSNK